MIANEMHKPLLTYKEILCIQEGKAYINNYHEFIFIIAGRGTYIRESVHVPFTEGDMFLISKGQEFVIEIEEEVVLYRIKFTEESKHDLKKLIKSSNGIASPPSKTKSPLNSKVVLSMEDQKLMKQLFEFVFSLEKEGDRNYTMILYQLLCIVTITERNLSYDIIKKSIGQEKILVKKILKYIHKNIKKPENLLLQRIADEFSLTPNKLGILFKKETEFSVKKYVNASRMKVIEERITNSELSFSEIAYEFGFVDESHFNKSFKKYFEISPSEYRRENSGLRR